MWLCVFVCRCDVDRCKGLLRPHVVWFGELLDPDILARVDKELVRCDLCLVVSVRKEMGKLWEKNMC